MAIRIVYRAFYDGDALKEFDSAMPNQTWQKLEKSAGMKRAILQANHYSVKRVKLGEEEAIASAALDVAEQIGGPKVGLVRKIGKLFGL